MKVEQLCRLKALRVDCNHIGSGVGSHNQRIVITICLRGNHCQCIVGRLDADIGDPQPVLVRTVMMPKVEHYGIARIGGEINFMIFPIGTGDCLREDRVAYELRHAISLGG